MSEQENVDFGKWLCERATYSVEAILRRNQKTDPLLFEDMRKMLMRSANSGGTSCQYSLTKLLSAVTGNAVIHSVTWETFHDPLAFENLKAYLQSKEVLGTTLIQIEKCESNGDGRADLDILLTWSLAEGDQVAKKTLLAKKGKPVTQFASSAKENPIFSLKKFLPPAETKPETIVDEDDSISYF
jgi:hypothetical protein